MILRTPKSVKWIQEIINNLVVNIIENSYGKNYIMLDKEHYDALAAVKTQFWNYL